MPAEPSSAAETLTGVIERIIFLNEENHYTIAELRPDAPAGPRGPARPKPEHVTVVGTLPGAFRHQQLGYVDALVMIQALVESPIP